MDNNQAQDSNFVIECIFSYPSQGFQWKHSYQLSRNIWESLSVQFKYFQILENRDQSEFQENKYLV